MILIYAYPLVRVREHNLHNTWEGHSILNLKEATY